MLHHISRQTRSAAAVSALRATLLFAVLLALTPALTFGQFRVQGVVVDEAQNPLPGASVVEPGTTVGTITDSDGEFDLMVSGPQANL
ncbi:MAG: carboxypeptidase-like regulatory domain-containing protein, partial [Rhodothermales bacterium]